MAIVRAWTLNFSVARVVATSWWRSVALPAVLRGRRACSILEGLVRDAAKNPDHWIARTLPAAAVQLAQLGDLAPIFRNQSAEMFICVSDASLGFDNPAMYERGWPRTPRTALAAWCGFVGLTKATATHEYVTKAGHQEVFEFTVDSEEIADAARKAVEDYFHSNGSDAPIPPDLAERVILRKQMPNGRILKFEQPVDRISVLPESTPPQQRALLAALASYARTSGVSDLASIYGGFAAMVDKADDERADDERADDERADDERADDERADDVQDLSWFPRLGKALSHNAAYLAEYNFDYAVDAVAQASWADLVALAGDPISWRLGETLSTRVNRLSDEASEAGEEEQNRLLDSSRITIVEAASGSLLVVREMETIWMTGDASNTAFKWFGVAVNSIDIDLRLVALAAVLRLVDTVPDLANRTFKVATESNEIDKHIASRFPSDASLRVAASTLLEETIRAMVGQQSEEAPGAEPTLDGPSNATTIQMQNIAKVSAKWTAEIVEFGLAAQQVLNAAILTDAHLKEAGIPFSGAAGGQLQDNNASDTGDALGTVAYICRIVTRRLVKRSVQSIVSLAQERDADLHALISRASLGALSLREQRPYNNVRILVGEAWRPDLELFSAANPYLQQLLLLLDSITGDRPQRLLDGNEAEGVTEQDRTRPAWWTSGIESILTTIAQGPDGEATARAVEAVQASTVNRFETVFGEGQATIASRILAKASTPPATAE